MFGNRVQRLFGPKRGEMIGGWRKLHSEEINNLYCLPNIIRMIKSRRMRWAWHVARMGKKRNPYRVLVGKSEGKGLLGRPRHHKEIGWGGMDWIHVAQDRDQWRALLNMVMDLRVPQNGNFLSSCVTVSQGLGSMV
jgi:hypothetical protein